MKTLTLLGSTGSIGQNTLDIVRKNPEKLKIKYLTTHGRIDELIAQIDEFKPDAVVVVDEKKFAEAKSRITNTKLLIGVQALEDIAAEKVDLCVNAVVGASGVKPTMAAINNGINVALANKETLVTAGIIVMAAAKNKGVKIFPIDSEHSAIWQCLVGEDYSSIANIYVTASGGPFRSRTSESLMGVTVDQALAHPNWKMGAKITIDSATLMNKGFEVIETFWLYGTKLENIKVVVHPQSIIHSMVEFVDGSFKAQLGVPDMRMPIQYALIYPERWPLKVAPLNFAELKQLTFEEADLKTFKCLQLAYDALKISGTMPAVLNAANEISNKAFLDKKITFLEIGNINESVMLAHSSKNSPNLEEILETDKWAREAASKFIK
jgi:1-deoxy-D-xylulose-5-phosphate reductoisomerase